MAYMLFKYIRRKVKENQAKKEGLPLEEGHSIPDVPRTPTRTNRDSHELLSSPESLTTTALPAKTQATGNREEAERLRQKEKEARIRRWKLMLGLVLPNFLASIDVTIVAPAIPTISSHFSE